MAISRGWGLGTQIHCLDNIQHYNPCTVVQCLYIIQHPNAHMYTYLGNMEFSCGFVWESVSKRSLATAVLCCVVLMRSVLYGAAHEVCSLLAGRQVDLHGWITFLAASPGRCRHLETGISPQIRLYVNIHALLFCVCRCYTVGLSLIHI